MDREDFVIDREYIAECLAISANDKAEYLKSRIRDDKSAIQSHQNAIEGCEESLKIIKEKREEIERAILLTGQLKYVKNILVTKHTDYFWEYARYEENLEYHKSSIRRCEESIARLESKLEEALKNVKEIGEKEIDRMESEINQILSLKKVEKVELTSQILTVCTKTLTIKEPKYGEEFFLGKCEINIPLKMENINTIRIFNKTNEIYGYNNEMQHPHIFRSGDPCWGTAVDKLVYAFKNKSFLLTTIVALSFLETCDINDDAGKWVPSWGKAKVSALGEIMRIPASRSFYKKNGEISTNSYEDEEFYCECCDSYHDISERYICDCCGENTCGDCIEEVETYEGYRYICSTCLENQYVSCACCDQLVNTDDAQYIESERRYVCPDCLTTHYRWSPTRDTYIYITEEEEAS